MFTRVLVPLDGSDVAEQALGAAEELATRLGVSMHLVRVIDLPRSDYTYAYGYMIEGGAMAAQLDKERSLAQEYLDEVVHTLAERGIRATTELRHGAAPAELVAAMETGDVVVMASHGRSGIARWYLGSVAEQVVRSATAPVMLVRAATSPSRARRTPDLGAALPA